MSRRDPVVFSAGEREYIAEDIREAVRRAGVTSGSEIFVHADLGSLGKMGEVRQRAAFAQVFIDALDEAVGESGTVIMPTFTYSFCRGEVYDPQTSRSRVGLLGERWRRQPGVVRSFDPIFSVAARGPAQAHYAVAGEECFGEDSVFARLVERDALMLFIGDTFDMTFIHYVEQRSRVSYRYLKRFSGYVEEGEGRRAASVLYFVRPHDGSVRYDLAALLVWLEQREVVRTVELGASFVRSARARAVYEAVGGELSLNERFLITVGHYAHARG